MRELILKSETRLWLAIVGVATLVLGGAYTMAQQATRLAADDLPLSTAQTVKQELENGAVPADVVPAVKADLKSDTFVFVTVTDASRHILASSARLDGQPSLPPQGAFDYTARHGSDHFTWQPKTGVRIATYMMSYGTAPNNGFVITGRSLSQAENRTNEYGLLALAAWIAALAWSYVFVVMKIPRSATK